MTDYNFLTVPLKNFKQQQQKLLSNVFENVQVIKNLTQFQNGDHCLNSKQNTGWDRPKYKILSVILKNSEN